MKPNSASHRRSSLFVVNPFTHPPPSSVAPSHDQPASSHATDMDRKEKAQSRRRASVASIGPPSHRKMERDAEKAEKGEAHAMIAPTRPPTSILKAAGAAGGARDLPHSFRVSGAQKLTPVQKKSVFIPDRPRRPSTFLIKAATNFVPDAAKIQVTADRRERGDRALRSEHRASIDARHLAQPRGASRSELADSQLSAASSRRAAPLSSPRNLTGPGADRDRERTSPLHALGQSGVSSMNASHVSTRSQHQQQNPNSSSGHRRSSFHLLPLWASQQQDADGVTGSPCWTPAGDIGLPVAQIWGGNASGGGRGEGSVQGSTPGSRSHSVILSPYRRESKWKKMRADDLAVVDDLYDQVEDLQQQLAEAWEKSRVIRIQADLRESQHGGELEVLQHDLSEERKKTARQAERIADLTERVRSLLTAEEMRAGGESPSELGGESPMGEGRRGSGVDLHSACGSRGGKRGVTCPEARKLTQELVQKEASWEDERANLSSEVGSLRALVKSQERQLEQAREIFQALHENAARIPAPTFSLQAKTGASVGLSSLLTCEFKDRDLESPLLAPRTLNLNAEWRRKSKSLADDLRVLRSQSAEACGSERSMSFSPSSPGPSEQRQRYKQQKSQPHDFPLGSSVIGLKLLPPARGLSEAEGEGEESVSDSDDDARSLRSVRSTKSSVYSNFLRKADSRLSNFSSAPTSPQHPMAPGSPHSIMRKAASGLSDGRGGRKTRFTHQQQAQPELECEEELEELVDIHREFERLRFLNPFYKAPPTASEPQFDASAITEIRRSFGASRHTQEREHEEEGGSPEFVCTPQSAVVSPLSDESSPVVLQVPPHVRSISEEEPETTSEGVQTDPSPQSHSIDVQTEEKETAEKAVGVDLQEAEQRQKTTAKVHRGVGTVKKAMKEVGVATVAEPPSEPPLAPPEAVPTEEHMDADIQNEIAMLQKMCNTLRDEVEALNSKPSGETQREIETERPIPVPDTPISESGSVPVSPSASSSSREEPVEEESREEASTVRRVEGAEAEDESPLSEGVSEEGGGDQEDEGGGGNQQQQEEEEREEIPPTSVPTRPSPPAQKNTGAPPPHPLFPSSPHPTASLFSQTTPNTPPHTLWSCQGIPSSAPLAPPCDPSALFNQTRPTSKKAHFLLRGRTLPPLSRKLTAQFPSQPPPPPPSPKKPLYTHTQRPLTQPIEQSSTRFTPHFSKAPLPLPLPLPSPQRHSTIPVYDQVLCLRTESRQLLSHRPVPSQGPPLSFTTRAQAENQENQNDLRSIQPPHPAPHPTLLWHLSPRFRRPTDPPMPIPPPLSPAPHTSMMPSPHRTTPVTHSSSPSPFFNLGPNLTQNEKARGPVPAGARPESPGPSEATVPGPFTKLPGSPPFRPLVAVPSPPPRFQRRGPSGKRTAAPCCLGSSR
uniref:Uncharacterized protein n=1 Tax=Chromera velia CCMP2878 TaxID=1169474 RepID=A0A0G4GHM4_9ALVE|eukprot:Cvel_21922.t1-p1 / transcript=Cvel_21922.t1 / gene=Cvel_21922 / organism=Chromera_velia_CCMP2878 / gene_product=hypothetical protein / transcript_product=hypothetical protein / location=Cvel_scaffold2102:6450-13378(-) / protein_length=1406 / sequence_SO=supercontig / SO=protein_coding / is_pseudo=false